MNEFRCFVHLVGDDSAVVTVEGEIDMATGEQFRRCVDDALSLNTAQIVVDLSKCPFIDSTGLTVFVGACRKGPSALHVVVPHEHVLRVLTISSLDCILTIHSSKAEALAALGRIGIG